MKTPAALFCGDYYYNFFGKPSCLFINDLADYNASLKLKSLKITTVYPGRGKPFPAMILRLVLTYNTLQKGVAR